MTTSFYTAKERKKEREKERNVEQVRTNTYITQCLTAYKSMWGCIFLMVLLLEGIMLDPNRLNRWVCLQFIDATQALPRRTQDFNILGSCP